MQLANSNTATTKGTQHMNAALWMAFSRLDFDPQHSISVLSSPLLSPLPHDHHSFYRIITPLCAKPPSSLLLAHILLTLPISLSDELEFLNSALLIKPKANTSTHHTRTHVTADNELAH